jgi:hypothetical protein
MNSLFDPRLTPESRKQWLSVASDVDLNSIQVDYNTEADCAVISFTRHATDGLHIFAMSREIYETLSEDAIREYLDNRRPPKEKPDGNRVGSN